MDRRCLFNLRRGLAHCLPILGLSLVSCTIDVPEDKKPQQVDTSPDNTAGTQTSPGASNGSNGTSPGQPNASGTTPGTGGQGGTSGQGTGDGAGTNLTSGPSGGMTTNDPVSGGGTNMTSGVTTTTTTTTTTNDTSSSCPNESVSFDPVIPSVYVLVDRSGSMGWGLGDIEQPAFPPAKADQRWEIVKKALIAPSGGAGATEGVISRMQSQVKFAVATYTTETTTWDDPNNGEVQITCPLIKHVKVGGVEHPAPRLNNLDPIKTLLGDTPSRGTPSAEAVYDVWQEIQKNTDENRILVFATDGKPFGVSEDGCRDGNAGPYIPNTYTGTPEKKVVDLVKAMKSQNISTYVIGVGNTTALEAHLNDVAKAGVDAANGGANPNPAGGDKYFFPGESAQALENAFNNIVVGARSCKFKLRTAVKDGFQSTGVLTINSQAKTYEDPNGWRLNGLDEVELLGSACQQVKSEVNVQLNVEFSCHAFEPG